MIQPPAQKLRIIVAGMVGTYPLGGVAWDYFHYVLGLHRLGHDVYYHEDTWCWPLSPVKGFAVDDPQPSVDFIRDFFQTYAPELCDRWHFLFLHDKSFGMERSKFDEIARTADIFLNVSGASFFPDDLNPKCLKVFLDSDPGYNQIMLSEKFSWSENVQRWCDQVNAHDRHLTYAENIWGDDCLLPKVGIDWRPTRCVVTLAEWSAIRDQSPPPGAAFTTVMSWSYFKGKLIFRGVEYGAKAPEYEKFHDLPKRVDLPLTLAVAGQHKNNQRILDDGWNLVEGWPLTLTSANYMKFIADSLGEWSVAKNCYVATNSGWFSCRTACYLAAGRPAVVQDTAWSRFIPSGEGLIAFTTIDEVIDGLKKVSDDPRKHRLKAFEIAREYLAADRVLPAMLEAIAAPTRSAAALPPKK